MGMARALAARVGLARCHGAQTGQGHSQIMDNGEMTLISWLSDGGQKGFKWGVRSAAVWRMSRESPPGEHKEGGCCERPEVTVRHSCLGTGVPGGLLGAGDPHPWNVSKGLRPALGHVHGLESLCRPQGL